MPKFERYTLGLKIIDKSFYILDLILLARTKKGASAILIIQKIDVELLSIQTRVRLAHEMSVVSQKQYILVSEILTECGKIIGGWLKNIKEAG